MIKVSDFGLSEDMYCTKYFRRREDGTASDEKVPIRWMAPECIETDKYTERTDVVGYTITLDCSTVRGRTKAPTVRNFVHWKLSNGQRLHSRVLQYYTCRDAYTVRHGHMIAQIAIRKSMLSEFECANPFFAYLYFLAEAQ